MSNTNFGPAFDAVDEATGEPRTITLPMAGADGQVRDYVIGEGTGAEMLRLWAVQSIFRSTKSNRLPPPGDVETVNGLSQRDMMDMALGHDIVERALTDGVPMPTLQRAIAAATAFRLGDMDAAQAAWSGKAPSPKTRSGKTGGGGGATRKASTSGTSTRRKSKSK